MPQPPRKKISIADVTNAAILGFVANISMKSWVLRFNAHGGARNSLSTYPGREALRLKTIGEMNRKLTIMPVSFFLCTMSSHMRFNRSVLFPPRDLPTHSVNLATAKGADCAISVLTYLYLRAYSKTRQAFQNQYTRAATPNTLINIYYVHDHII